MEYVVIINNSVVAECSCAIVAETAAKALSEKVFSIVFVARRDNGENVIEKAYKNGTQRMARAKLTIDL